MALPLTLDSDNSPSYVTELLYRLKVRDVMTTRLKTVTRKQSLREAQALMKESTVTGLPVSENQRLLGIISMDDIIRALEGGWMDDPAEARMTKGVTVLEDDMPLAFALSWMEKYRFGRFPVLDRSGILVGIITSRDIIVHLLLAMNKEMEVLEQKIHHSDPSHSEDATQGIAKQFSIRRLDFEHAGIASASFKKICQERGLNPKLIRRIAVASYELEMNLVIHSSGGRLKLSLDDTQAIIRAKDDGPGIEDVNLALTEGWSTANEWVRSLGFGAGMGLPNARRVSDEFAIESKLGKGTSVECRFTL